MARNAGFAVVFAFCSFLFARHAMRLASSELRHENAKWKQFATTGSNHFWRTIINFINLNFKFNFWLLDHQCMIFIDPLMETQLFKYTNASTEIIGPIVRYSCRI